MRALFTSEQRCISNLIRMRWNGSYGGSGEVISEYIAEPANTRQGPRFNCDFAVDLVDRQSTDWEHMATMSSILPNTLGADVFLVVEKHSLTPMRLELMGGEAFPIKYFSKYVELIEESIRVECKAQRCRGSDTLSWPISRTAFARIVIVGNDACFLYSPVETTPMMRGRRSSIVSAVDRDICCYSDDGQIVCIDGWIRVDVNRTEEVLVAVPNSRQDRR